MQLPSVIFLILTSLFLLVSTDDLEEQNQDYLNPVDDYEYDQKNIKEQDKRTIFSSRPKWAKHVGIHPLGFKYVIGYGPVDYKYIPVVRPVAFKPHHLHKVKPVIHHDGWKPIAVHKPWDSFKPVHVHHPVGPSKPLIPIVPAHPVVPGPPPPVAPAHPVVTVVPGKPHLHPFHFPVHAHVHGTSEFHGNRDLVPLVGPHYQTVVHQHLPQHPPAVPHVHQHVLPHVHPHSLPHFHQEVVPHIHQGVIPHVHQQIVPHVHQQIIPHAHQALVPHVHQHISPHLLHQPHHQHVIPVDQHPHLHIQPHFHQLPEPPVPHNHQAYEPVEPHIQQPHFHQSIAPPVPHIHQAFEPVEPHLQPHAHVLPHQHHLIPQLPEPHQSHQHPHVHPDVPIQQLPLEHHNIPFQQNLQDIFHQHLPAGNFNNIFNQNQPDLNQHLPVDSNPTDFRASPPFLINQQLPGNIQHLFNQQIQHGDGATSSILLHGAINPGHTDVQIPEHLPQHPNYQFGSQERSDDVPKPSIGLEAPLEN